MNFDEIKSEDKEYIINSYNRFDVAIKEGNGSTLYDFEGRKYIDFGSGIGVTSFGFNDKLWVDAVVSQAKAVQHTSNLYYTSPQAKLAKMLCEKTGMKKVFFSNSGAEANEGAIKAARKYSHDKYNNPNRYEIITLQGSFHGRTMATLSATGQDKFHTNFNPFLEGFKYAPIDDIDALKEMVNENTCAIMIETVQGEGGVNNIDSTFIKEIDRICKEKDLVFIVDEVQTGNGRTGYFYSYMEHNVNPNIVTTAKGIAGGLPMGAILFDEKLQNVYGYGDHGSTYGGNPVCANAACSIISRIDDELLNHVKDCNKIIVDELSKLKNVLKITGKGLMLGVETNKDASLIAKECLKRGLLVLTAKTRIRLLPALNISFGELSEGLKILKEVISDETLA